MNTNRDAAQLAAAVDPGELFALPETGEALLTPKMVACALGIGESALWKWAKADPDFPRPVRKGERYTRFRLTEVRIYIAGLTAGMPKPGPAARRQHADGVQA